MNYESRKGHQAGKESAGMSSRPDPSKGHPARETPGADAASQATGDPSELEVFRGFRLWRVVDGQLRSWTNDTVWPTGHALVAEAHVDWRRLGENFWGLAFWVGLVSSGIIAISLWTLLAQFFSGATFVQLGPDLQRWAPIAIAGMTGGAVLTSGLGLIGDPTVRAIIGKLSGRTVVPGPNTPGIFAMRQLRDVVNRDRWVEPGEVIVRGSVWLWGDTVEHEHGVKGQYGYPGSITEVKCVACPDWLPISQYTVESKPPLHVGCLWPCSSCHGEEDGERWRMASLSELRSRAPQWFREA